MRRWITAFALIAAWPSIGRAENLAKEVKKAAERSTLDQSGTKPFHLRAELAPSFERDQESGRTGQVEIWWASPTRWKRDVRSRDFHQIEIVDGARDWQKNEGDYFPEWLRETAVELIKPVPPLDQVLEQVKTAEVRRMGSMTNLSWTTVSGTADLPNILRSYVALQDGTGLLLYAGGFGWSGEFKDYSNFHGLMIARTVNVGTPQVTAKVTILEDLRDVAASFFDARTTDGASQSLETLLLDESSLRKNLLPMEPVAWPPLQDGPLEGKVTTEVVVDREGKVREIGTVISENAVVNDAGKQAFEAMRFKPFLVKGMPAQAMSQITIPFKTVRPTGVEAFDSAQTYFEHGRHLAFPAAGTKSPYVLHAEFETRGSSGTVDKGRYARHMVK
jgi:TonB family protein